jgi:hypothetical protein
VVADTLNESSGQFGGKSISSERHALRRELFAKASCYNRTGTHLSVGKDAPEHRVPQGFGEIVSLSIPGGLHYQYLQV